LSNELHQKVLTEQLDKRDGKWLEADSTAILDFPILSMQDIKSITLGIYQINLAIRYTRQHIFENRYTIFVLKELTKDNNIRAKIDSRTSINTRLVLPV